MTLPAQHLQGRITIQDGQFRDEHGRTIHPRGVNCTGSSKLPTSPSGSSHLEEGFWEHREVSFVGRPFPLKDAPEHFRRLKEWGMTLLRLLVTWEALEHAGPGQYDEDYITYLSALLEMMAEYGIKCIVDPHQDTWSRFSGGSGAPGWTFEVAGMEMRNFRTTGASFVHNTHEVEKGKDEETDEPLPMYWPTNYTKLATSSMFTLFWGGETFAPSCTYAGISVQEYLQRHYCQAFAHLTRKLRHHSALLGMEVMNEPHPGYIGLKSFHEWNHGKDLVFGDSPSALQSMALGDGIPQEVGVWERSWPFPTRLSHCRWINQEGDRAWKQGTPCPWRAHGVWDIVGDGDVQVLRPNYFTQNPRTGKHIDFNQDFYLPFVRRYQEVIHQAWSDALIVLCPVPNDAPPKWDTTPLEGKLVYGPHWYDLKALFNKDFGFMTADVPLLSESPLNILKALYFGENGAIRNFTGQLGRMKKEGIDRLGSGSPFIIGECGIPMDLNDRCGQKYGDWSKHESFMNAMLSGMEANLLSYTLWNYSPLNDDTYGDHWNGENFSIYTPPSALEKEIGKEGESLEQEATASGSDDSGMVCKEDGTEDRVSPPCRLYKGGRVLRSTLRPYPVKIAGKLESFQFDPRDRHFDLKITPTRCSQSPGEACRAEACLTEIFLPDFHYHDQKMDIFISSGEWEYHPSVQTVHWRCAHPMRGRDEMTDQFSTLSIRVL
ncbi:glycoside hydrolase superfamily [Piptocephalis cylindrospora]|uniref:Glycoside hydrolase superfamily n=1 Tax=Piptocephalis cylindrospora TaxID=1907219 RepID=A0A4P9Y9N3_9FUNG|nr:glycoside hydrolase superfamily [Piptocephalis cylindrospora]|eukprot:RKP14740.1 glycoside hydrolase superfamily [Piptocephalis cylindrospora]